MPKAYHKFLPKTTPPLEISKGGVGAYPYDAHGAQAALGHYCVMICALVLVFGRPGIP